MLTLMFIRALERVIMTPVMKTALVLLLLFFNSAHFAELSLSPEFLDSFELFDGFDADGLVVEKCKGDEFCAVALTLKSLDTTGHAQAKEDEDEESAAASASQSEQEEKSDESSDEESFMPRRTSTRIRHRPAFYASFSSSPPSSPSSSSTASASTSSSRKSERKRNSAKPSRKPLHEQSIQQARVKMHHALLKRYNESRSKAGLEHIMRVKWSNTEVQGWPIEVKCKTPRGWNFNDIAVLQDSLSKISFKILPKTCKNATNQQRHKLNLELHDELLKKSRILGLACENRDAVDWQKIHAKFPAFLLSNRDFRNWSEKERANIRKVLIDDLIQKELDKLKK